MTEHTWNLSLAVLQVLVALALLLVALYQWMR
jgi:hypothetical protein